MPASSSATAADEGNGEGSLKSEWQRLRGREGGEVGGKGRRGKMSKTLKNEDEVNAVSKETNGSAWYRRLLLLLVRQQKRKKQKRSKSR